MPPKQATDPTTQPTPTGIAIIRAVMCSLPEFKPDWQIVQGQFGVAKGRGNGPRAFRKAIEPLGLTFEDGKVFPVDASKGAAAYAPLIDIKGTNGKRKSTDSHAKEAKGDEGANKAKKAKKNDTAVKSEVKDEKVDE